MFDRAEVGRAGEEIAEEYLKRRGFKILQRNWKTLRWGEIDIVALDGKTLVVVEVKTRRRDTFAKPFEAVNYFKLRTLVRAAQNYKLRYPKSPSLMRIDVVSVVLEPVLKIEYFRSVYEQ